MYLKTLEALVIIRICSGIMFSLSHQKRQGKAEGGMKKIDYVIYKYRWDRNFRRMTQEM